MSSKSETAFVRESLNAKPALRADGRSLLDYRAISIATGVIPLANGSSRASIDGTEVLASSKLEVVDDEGCISCSVICSPSAYSSLSPGALDDLQYDHTQILQSTFSDSSLVPSNLTIIPGKKSWQLNLDVLVLSDAGNIYDVIFMAARAALLNTKVPRTSSVEYRAPKGSAESEGMGFAIKKERAVDFEIKDYWDEGEELAGHDRWPVCVTLNVNAAVHFLDATLLEEAAVPYRLLLMFSFPLDVKPLSAKLHGMRLLGPGEITMTHLQSLVLEGERHARALLTAVNAQLKSNSHGNASLGVYTIR